jgi:DNA-binding winged helix-turn-helix (wHTH) protein/Tfp pilus assembly protein PilF
LTTENPADCWQLAHWRIEPDSHRLYVQPTQTDTATGPQPQLLEPRVMTALVLLLQANGRTLTDAEFMQGVWPGLVVSDASLYKVVAELRKALGDQQKPYTLIERVHGKGYRLLQPAVRLEAPIHISATAACSTDTLLTTALPSTTAVAVDATPSQAQRSIWRQSWLWLLLVLSAVVFGWWQLKVPPEEAEASPQAVKPLSSTQLDPAAGFSWPQWQQFQQAQWLVQQTTANEIEQGMTLLQQLLPQQQNYAPLLVELCNSYHAMHIYSDWPLSKVQALCEPLLRQALQLHPNSASALASFGALLLSQNKLDAAALYLDQALALDAHHSQALLWRATLYRQQDQYPQAIKLLQRAIQLNPLSGVLKRHYAYSLIGNGMLSEARSQFQQALLLEGDYSDRALDELEMLPLTSARAIAYLRWAQRFPDRLQQPGRLVNLALVQLSLNQFDAAAQTLEQASNTYPTHHFVLLARAMLMQARGEPAAARRLLQQRAERRPDHAMFQLQALLLPNDQDFTRLAPAFLRLYPAFAADARAAVTQALAQKQQVLVLYWLLTQSPTIRQQWQAQIRTFVSAQTEPDSLDLQLLCAVGLTSEANQLARQLLQQDWLPSPHDHYYLAEQHPLWQQLAADIFAGIRQQRLRVQQALQTVE